MSARLSAFPAALPLEKPPVVLDDPIAASLSSKSPLVVPALVSRSVCSTVGITGATLVFALGVGMSLVSDVCTGAAGGRDTFTFPCPFLSWVFGSQLGERSTRWR